MKSPIYWVGGKFYITRHLLPLIRDHHCYCEVFGGGAQLLFAKPLSTVEIYNDIDSGLVNFFRVLQVPEQFAEFQRYCATIPYSRELYYEYKDKWEKEENSVTRAFYWFYICRSSFAGRFGNGWGYSKKKPIPQSFFNAIDGLPEVVSRWQHVQVENRDWRDVLDAVDGSDTFFYLDPPYVHSSRTGQKEYRHEMSDTDHEELIERIQSLKAKVILSGYENDIYKKLDWQKRTYEKVAYSKGLTINTNENRKPKRTEVVWMNYEPPEMELKSE